MDQAVKEKTMTTQVVRLYRDKDGVIIGSQEVPELEELEHENRLLRARNDRLESAVTSAMEAVEYIKQLVTKLEQQQGIKG
jgi:hypothetical protein